MKKLKIIAGIFWAFVCLIMVLALFPGLNGFSATVARLPFMKINPNYTGGDVARQIDRAQYSIDIRKPVFAGLTGERKKGFLQVDWRGNIPEELTDSIDFDNDKKPDFTVHIVKDSARTELKPINPRVGEILVSTPASYGWAVRVSLTK